MSGFVLIRRCTVVAAAGFLDTCIFSHLQAHGAARHVARLQACDMGVQRIGLRTDLVQTQNVVSHGGGR